MTPSEFKNHRLGYFDRIESMERAEWIRNRWLGFMMFKANGVKKKGGGQFLSPTDILVFDWERQGPKEAMELKEKARAKFPDRL